MKRVCLMLMAILIIATLSEDELIRVIILGETGQGKSTTIRNVFKVKDYVPIGHDIFKSMTKNVHSYNVDHFVIYDSPGFYDIGNGLSNEQILDLIDIELQQISSTPNINAMLLIVSTHKVKEGARNHLADYITLFGESMLETVIVVINHYEGDPERDAWRMEERMNIMLEDIIDNSENFNSKHLSVPVVVINCKNPTKDEISMLHHAIQNVNDYALNHLDDKREKIQEIFEKILLDPENYKDEIEYMIVNETRKVTKQVPIKQAKKVPVRKCGTEKAGFSVLGISASWENWKCHDTTEMVVVDVIETLQEETTVPVPKEQTIRVLKNEQDVYYELAKKIFKNETFTRFKDKQ